jgi:glycosidase
MRTKLLIFGFLSGCCGNDAPAWIPLEPVLLDDGTTEIELLELVSDDKGTPVFTAEGTADVLAEISGTTLRLTPQPEWEGAATIVLTAVDGCDNAAVTELPVEHGIEPDAASCGVELSYTAQGAPDAVTVAGAFNDWDPDADRMTDNGDGSWSITLDLDPGSYGYKFVELDEARFEDGQEWSCDPAADYIQCDAGYREPWDWSWSHECAPNNGSCNSLLVVESCAVPTLAVTTLDIDRASNQVTVTVEATPGAAAIATATARLDGLEVDAGWDGERFSATFEGLAEGRHTLRFDVVDADGVAAEQVYVPLWTDDWQWDEATMYFAFVDRFANGDPARDGSEGATAETGGYLGGDFEGLIGMLPYLDDLGVDVIWLSNAQDNTEGEWAGDCGKTYAGYHAYWPDDPHGVEEHFGSEDDLHRLIDTAHARGMRVIMDWVANHVHETHPYYVEHPEWFNGQAVCKDEVDGQQNWNRIPESCWFAPYLPDIDYTQPEPLTLMVDDALWWAKTYELDGFRVDAVKHMPHAVAWNLASAVHDELEHRDAGGDELFWTVGETFDGYDPIKAYIGDNQLVGQFDFPLYFDLRGAFIYGDTDLPGLMATTLTSEATWGDALMSNFLGNHDVMRWMSESTEGYQYVCPDGENIRIAPVSDDPYHYARMNLAWTWVFTQRAVPLIYYGDEIAVPGYTDPDNRQPLWWFTGGDLEGVTSVDTLAGRVTGNQGWVLDTVAQLSRARKDHPAMRSGPLVTWWEEPDVYAYSRTESGDAMIALFNRSGDDRSLGNGLSFAGLPTDGTYTDVVTGETFVAASDFVEVWLPANTARVLVHTP